MAIRKAIVTKVWAGRTFHSISEHAKVLAQRLSTCATCAKPEQKPLTTTCSKIPGQKREIRASNKLKQGKTIV